MNIKLSRIVKSPPIFLEKSGSLIRIGRMLSFPVVIISMYLKMALSACGHGFFLLEKNVRYGVKRSGWRFSQSNLKFLTRLFFFSNEF